MKIAIIYDKFRDDTLGEHYKRTLVGMGHTIEHFWLKDSHHIEPRFDVYLRVDDGDYKYDIPHKRLRPSFFYVSDVHLKKPFSAIKKAAHFYSHIFCAQHNGYLELRRLYGDRVSWLPHACDAGMHCDLGAERKLDIAFVGNDGGIPRKFLLQEIRERFPNSYVGNAPHTEIFSIYSRAKLGFNYSIANDINMRMFEIMGCGALLLTNHIRNNGFNILFEKERCLSLYSAPKEIFSKIDYYLTHEKERLAIAETGKRLVAAGHTYRERALFILSVIKKYSARSGTISARLGTTPYNGLPLPFRGEGRGEGVIRTTFPLTLILSPEGRGNIVGAVPSPRKRGTAR